MSKTTGAARDYEIRDGNDFWIFGYGSLMWNPGFDYAERRAGLLWGYHRRFCLFSHRYRGTPDKPGLVLGLDRGGCCRGVVFRVGAAHAREVRDYLWEREMNMNSYHARAVEVATDHGPVVAMAFIVRREHPQYAGKLTAEELVQYVVQGAGGRGTCREYLANTVKHLDELGLTDGPLHDLLRVVERRCVAANALLKP
ncbi:MAG TPA: gamma-glutamylcyclotransferase [Burkholderiales bacterium]|nr:gamma-glutamylcyclotransferase [Burkholderiales bacterium]